MIKNTIITLGLLAFTSTVQATAISFMPASPLTITTNGGGAYLDVNNDGINDIFFDSTYTNSPFGGTYTNGTSDPSDDIHYQGTTEETTMSISVLSGQATFYNLPYGWLMQPNELGPANNDIYSEEYSSLEECNNDYSHCDYYDDYFISGIMEFDGTGYIGFTFDIAGSAHWGWLFADRRSGLSIESWGWESDADTLIHAGYGEAAVVPVPASLYLFVSGLIGLVSIKRKKH